MKHDIRRGYQRLAPAFTTSWSMVTTLRLNTCSLFADWVYQKSKAILRYTAASLIRDELH